jgi:hypothetical protein
MSDKEKLLEDEPTLVVFRVYPDGEVVALFPEIPAADNGRLCSCYALVGQHGAADFRQVQHDTRPATKAQYWHTQVVLERLGYTLKVRQRVSRFAHSARQREARGK